jgi:hypothetical protein
VSSSNNTLRNNKKKKSQPANVAGWIIVIRWMLQQNKRLQP